MGSPANSEATPSGLIRGMGLGTATALNMIDMIGVGPFITMPLVLGAMGGPQALLGWIVGALLAVYLRDYPYDIYTQIGIVTLIGLSAKNAILIVEFAKERVEHGLSIRESAMEAANLRLRPILMTSFAFILGVFPLVIASGASSGARRALGTAVFGGMLASTLLAIFIVPVLFVVVELIASRRKPARGNAPAAEVAG